MCVCVGGEKRGVKLVCRRKRETDLWDVPRLDHAHQGVVCADASLKYDEAGESRERVRVEGGKAEREGGCGEDEPHQAAVEGEERSEFRV
jgi:hypothetical protein